MVFARRRLLCWVLLSGLAGCGKLSLRSQNPDDDEIKPPQTTYIKDQVTVSGLHPITIEAVGLVVGLDNTGGEPPPSVYRTMLTNEMKRRGVPNPNKLLQSPTVALVLIRAAVPPVIDVGERFDVEVVLPDNGEATSLKGGYLMEAYLSEQAITPGGRVAPGHVLAKAEGPVMLSTGEGSSDSTSSALKRGRILGGGRYIGGLLRKGREMGLYVRSDLRSVRTTRKIESQIGRRFYHHDHGIKHALATARTDQYIELKVHPRYKQNYVRYVQVIRNIALDESEPQRRERMERLRRALLVPTSASPAATELEAIGSEAILVLKDGLKSPDPEVRYYSADALAYLGDGSGIGVLIEAARNEPAFRVFALAALTTLATPEARDELKNLMVKPSTEIVDDAEHEVWSAETRYGAFQALRTIDKTDELIAGENMNDEFQLHVIPADGDSLVHMTRYRVPEIVVFGEQKLRTPISLSAGRYIMITAPNGSQTVTINRFDTHGPDQQVTCSTSVADIIRAVGKLKAAYPDVAQMLVQAERQSNLTGRLEIDAVPQSGRFYFRNVASAVAGSEAVREKTRIGKPGAAPNMFPAVERRGADADQADADEGRSAGESVGHEPGERGEASLADASDDAQKKDPQPKGLRRLFRPKEDAQ